MSPEELIPKVTSSFLNEPGVELLQAQIGNFFSVNLPLIKALSLLVSLFFLVSGIYFTIRTNWLQLRIDRIRDVILRTNIPKKRSIKAWKNIQKHFFAGSDSELKVAIIEADNLLDEALRMGGVKGASLGDKLKQLTEDDLKNIDEIWEAHKLRNKIAHEADFKMNRDTAERALGVYERTFQDLGILD